MENINNNKRVYTKSDLFVWFLTYFWLTSFITLSTNVSGFMTALITTVLLLIATDFKLNIGSFHKHVIAFYIVGLLSVFWAYNYRIVMLRSTTILEVFICMCVFYDYYIRLGKFKILLNIIVLSGYTVAIYAYFYYGVENMFLMAREGVRLGNEFANVNSFCMIAAMSVIIDVYMSLYGKFRKTLIFAIPVLILISFSQSRKALFMVFFAPIMMYLYKNSRNITKDLRPMLKIIAGLVFAGFIVSLFSDSNIFIGLTRRTESLIRGLQGSEETDTSTFLRLQMIEIGLKEFKNAPFLGIGLGNSLVVMSREMGQNTYFHNNYVELLAGVGLIGTTIYYSIHLSLLRRLWQYRKQETVCILFIMMIVTTLFTDYGAVSYYSKSTYFYFMTYFAFLEQCKSKYGRNPALLRQKQVKKVTPIVQP